MSIGIRVALLFSLTSACAAQTAPAAQLSPAAAYEEATSPVAIVHRSVGNWSDSETTSLAVAIKNGAVACLARRATDYAGDQLIAYARLCSLGQNWFAAGEAAGQYIASTDAAKPQLAMAYAIKLESALHAHDNDAIRLTARDMLKANPYDAIVDAAFNEAVEYLQLAYTEYALSMMWQRHELLLKVLAEKETTLPASTLYADELALAALEQYSNQPESAARVIAEADGALRTDISSDQSLLIAEERRGYAMLGKPLPKITLQLSLMDLKMAAPIDPDQGMSTALLVFPPWCAQCVRMVAEGMAGATAALGKNGVRIYALLAGPLADATALIPPPAPPKPVGTAKRGVAIPPPIAPMPTGSPTAAALLLHTPTFIVPPATLGLLHASDFPFLIVLDRQGNVRFAQVAPESALAAGDFATRAAEQVAEQWPQRGQPAVIQ